MNRIPGMVLVALGLAEVRHGMNVERPKSFRISLGYREVCTTF